MKIKRLLLRILINVLIVFCVVGIIHVVPMIYNNKFYVDTAQNVSGELTIEDGSIFLDGIEQSNYSSEQYIFNDQDYYELYLKTVDEVIKNSNDIQIVGDASIYLRYLQTVPQIVCVYNDTQIFDVNRLGEINVAINAINQLLNLNISVMPLSYYTDDTGADAIKKLLENGTVQIGIYTDYPFTEQSNITENASIKMSNPFSLEKLYEVSIIDDSDIDLSMEKIAFIDELQGYNFENYREDNILILKEDEAIRQLKDGEIAHIVELNSKRIDEYAEDGFYMSIVDKAELNGLNYFIGTDEYIIELINIIDELFSSKSTEKILEFGEEKYNYASLYYLNESLAKENMSTIKDRYIDVAYTEHIGMIDNSPTEIIEGYSVDILKYLSRSVGVRFRLHNYSDKSYEERQNDLENGVVDVVLNRSVASTKRRGNIKENHTLSSPYLATKFDIQMKVGTETISSLDNLSYKSMGTVVNDFTDVESFLKYKLREVGGTDIQVYSSYKELANALKMGEIEYAITYPGFTTYMQKNGELWSVDAYSENSFQGYNSVDFCLEITNSEEMQDILLDIDRGISSINEQDLTVKWFYLESIYGSIVYERTQQSIFYIILLLVIAIMILAALYSLFQQDKTETYLTDILLKDEITGLGNRQAYNKAIEDNTREIYCIKTRIPNYKFLLTSLKRDEQKTLMKLIANRILEFNDEYENSECFYLEGDEFVVLIEHSENFDITKYIENLMEILSVVFIIKDEQVAIKIQMVAVFNKLIDFENSKMLMYCSTILDSNSRDEQNYSAILTTGMLQMLKRVELIDSLFNQDFEEIIKPYYYPIYSTKSKTIVGLEVVGRLITDDAIISNTEYFDYALETDIIGIIQATLFEKMLIDRQQLIEDGVIDKDFIFAITISEVFLSKYLSNLSTLIDKYKVDDMSFIHIKLAENVISRPAVTNEIKILQAINMKIVVDKFIVGHSSLGKIIELGVDIISIEHHVIEESTRNVDASLFDALVNMVDGMEVPICVCDISNATDYAKMQSDRIEYLQGSYFLRPLPVNIVKEYIVSGKYIDYEL